ncbi:Protein GrpE [Desulfosarcina cetonica]|uniref:nucleotide exchange factor GrpE n=1 Tax=Desulfosarcina cetonica TaxID=90730 RepID=UPI0006D1AA52|nr:nucleotide exchange factor GrpE [Desulfosarcina cetonica]VTR66414.1 Protein GrpE [Desulfosarcina cetonica]
MAPEKKIVIEDENEKATMESVVDPAAETPDEKGNVTHSPSDLEAQLAAARAEAKENHDRTLRMAAELENYKKRAARERDDLRKFANERLISQLLTVVDNLERAIASAAADNQNGQSLVDGVSLTLAEIMKILEQNHVTPIESLGEPFDPAFHQAMCQEACSDQPPNTVVQEYQKGYLIHDRLLRPAMVVVSTAAKNGNADVKTVNTNA